MKWSNDPDVPTDMEIDTMLAEVESEAERLRVQLAGCSVAALGNTAEAAAQRAKPGDWGYSASYGDVCAAVDREMAERENVAALTAQVERLREALIECGECQHYCTRSPQPGCDCSFCAALFIPDKPFGCPAGCDGGRRRG